MNENKIEMLQKEFDDAVKNIKEAFEGLKAEIISVDKPEYKTVKRAAKVGEKILITNPKEDSAGAVGEVFTVTRACIGDVDVEEIRSYASHFAFKAHEYEVIVPEIETVKRKAEIGERVLVVNAMPLFTQYENGDVFTASGVDNTSNSIDVKESDNICLFHEEYEVIVEPEQVPVIEEFPDELTPNEQREKLIEQAKEFVNHFIEEDGDILFNSGDREVECTPEFIVNKKNRMVTVLLRGCNTGKLYAKGIAICAPGDVFNEWIGKAIALARALEIDIPEEFLNAVQPDKVVVGHLTLLKKLGTIARVVDKPCFIEGYVYRDNRGNAPVKSMIILDDTKAVYSEVINQ